MELYEEGEAGKEADNVEPHMWPLLRGGLLCCDGRERPWMEGR